MKTSTFKFFILISVLYRAQALFGQELGKPFDPGIITRQYILDSLNRTGVVYDTSAAGTSYISGPGPRLIWIPDRSAFRAGEVASAWQNYWDGPNCGEASAAFGDATEASGQYSFSEGYDNIASGRDAHAEGYAMTASGINAHAEGDNGAATQLSSHVEGHYNVASGAFSHAEGAYTTASGFASRAGGNHSIAYFDGQEAWASGATSNGAGVAQCSRVVLRARTSDATPTELKFSGIGEYIPSFAPDKQLVVPLNKAWYFRIYVVARNYSNDANIAAFRSEGIISNVNSTVTLLGGSVNQVAGQGGSLGFSVDADNTAHALRLKGSGIGGTSMNWVAEVQLTEIAAD